VDNVRAKNFIIPRALLPDKHHIWWAGGLQRCKGSLGKGALIPNNHLRQKRLQVWPVTNEADMRQTASTFRARCSLHEAVWVLHLVCENMPLGIALKQTD